MLENIIVEKYSVKKISKTLLMGYIYINEKQCCVRKVSDLAT